MERGPALTQSLESSGFYKRQQQREKERERENPRIQSFTKQLAMVETLLFYALSLLFSRGNEICLC
jgi:hypothetical protein